MKKINKIENSELLDYIDLYMGRSEDDEFIRVPLYQKALDFLDSKGLSISSHRSSSGKHQFDIWKVKDNPVEGWEPFTSGYGFESKYEALDKAIENAIEYLEKKLVDSK